jgi:tetratricopeptide (TPR) repeat protein
MKGKDSVTPQDRLTAAMEHEVAGDKRKALDYYKQARAAAADSAAKTKAEDGVAACQGYFARCADAAKYQHPEAGKTKKYDSRAKALDAAVMRTRAGERVTVRGCDVMPTKDSALDYVVVVGNIGTVYSGPSQSEAMKHYSEYVRQSKTGGGRAGGEDVTLFKNDQIVKEHEGTQAQDSLSPVRVGGRDASEGRCPEGDELLERGRVFSKKKDWENAVKAYKKAVSVYSDYGRRTDAIWANDLYNIALQDRKKAAAAKDALTPVKVVAA